MKRRIVITFTMLLLVSGAAMFASFWKGKLMVTEVQVKGNRIVGQDAIVELAAIPQGVKLFDVDLYGAQRRILMNLFIKEVQVQRNTPSTISIVVTERVPAAMVIADRMYYLDEEGVVLPPSTSPDLFDLPVITGKMPALRAGARTTDGHLYEALTIISLAKAVDEELYRQISEIHLDGERDIVLYTAECGVPVILGHGEVGEKLVKLDGFWKSIVSHYGAQELHYIDLRFHDQVVVRWSKDSGAHTHASHS